MLKSTFLISPILLFSCFFLVFACKKDNNTTNSNTNSSNITNKEYYITFELDGDTIEFGTNQGGANSGWSRNNQQVATSNIDDLVSIVWIGLGIEGDSITESDYMAIVGQKLPIGECQTEGCESAYLDYEHINGDFDYTTYRSSNSFPENYMQIDSVIYHNTYNNGQKQFIIRGRFNLVFSDLSFARTNVTNGKFRLLFQEKW